MGNEKSKGGGGHQQSHHSIGPQSSTIGEADEAKFQPAFERLTDGKQALDVHCLQHIFGDNFGRALWRHFVNGDEQVSNINLKEFALRAKPLLGTSTDVYVKAFCSNDGTASEVDVANLLKSCRAATGLLPHPSDENFITNIANAMLISGQSADDVISWKARHCPNMALPLQRIFEQLVTQDKQQGGRDYSSDAITSFQMWFVQASLPPGYFAPQRSIGKQSSAVSSNSNSNACWTPLYSSAEQGTSYSRFERNVFGYKGHTITIIRLTDNAVFALGVDQEWRSSGQQWGGADAVCMQLEPVYKFTDELCNGVCFNTTLRTSASGLTVGRDPRTAILHVEADFSNVVAIEVWGCAGAETLQQQQKVKEWQSRQVEKNKKVPLPGKWEDNPDKFLLEMAGVGGNVREHMQEIIDRDEEYS